MHFLKTILFAVKIVTKKSTAYVVNSKLAELKFLLLTSGKK